MPALARAVIPGEPHHVTQRGNRRQQTFFCDEDYEAYIELMAEWCEREGVARNPQTSMSKPVQRVPPSCPCRVLAICVRS